MLSFPACVKQERLPGSKSIIVWVSTIIIKTSGGNNHGGGGGITRHVCSYNTAAAAIVVVVVRLKLSSGSCSVAALEVFQEV